MQEPTRIIAIRHGETHWNVDARIQGHIDIPLNEAGHRQARQLAQALKDETLGAIYASDLARARQTAQPLADQAGIVPIFDPALRERCFGSFEGQIFTDIESSQPAEAALWRRREPDFSPAGGESLRVFGRRVVEAVYRIAARHPGEQIALVSHGGVMDVLYREATRLDIQAPRSWALGNAAINRLLWTQDGLSLVGWGDTSHLEWALDDDGLGQAAVTQ